MAKNRKPVLKTANSQFIEDNVLNDITFDFYLRCFKKLCLSMFEWVNLPKGMDPRFLEEVLYYNGIASLLYDEEYRIYKHSFHSFRKFKHLWTSNKY